jgi:hypothetical protein
LPRRKGLLMNKKGFAKKEKFSHEEERFCEMAKT